MKSDPTEGRTFSAKQVCAVLGVPSGTFFSWAHHGLFARLDAAVTTQGKARRFTFKDLIRLAISKQLLDFGVATTKAREWAHGCIMAIELSEKTGTPPPDEMNVFLIPEGDEKVHLGDDNPIRWPGDDFLPAGAAYPSSRSLILPDGSAATIPSTSPFATIRVTIYPVRVIAAVKRKLALIDEGRGNGPDRAPKRAPRKRKSPERSGLDGDK